MTDRKYNGYKNRQTWNVALWVENDYGLYNTALEYLKTSKRQSWTGFIRFAELEGKRTPDRISYSGARLDYAALTGLLRDLAD